MTTIRKYAAHQAEEAIARLNRQRLDILRNKAGLIFHADATPAIATPDATDLPTSVALANALKASYNAHCASAVSATTGVGVHLAADVTNPTAVVDATDLATASTLLNDIKSKYAAHRVLTTSHPIADATNAVATADATTQGTPKASDAT